MQTYTINATGNCCISPFHYSFETKGIPALKLDPVWSRPPQKRRDIKESNENEVRKTLSFDCKN